MFLRVQNREKIKIHTQVVLKGSEHFEAIQKIVDLAAGLPSRCSELLEALEDKSSASHGGNNVSPVQRDQRDKTAEVIVGSEQRD